MKKYLLIICTFLIVTASAQNKTASSLYFKKDKTQINQVESKNGNLFNQLGHHGPAIENQWLGIRYYFSKKSAIDLYSKERQGLELAEKKWYPTDDDQLNGWGADYYKVGKSVGLGGIWLWDGEKVLKLNPVNKRTASVFTNANYSQIVMLAEDVPYMKQKVDISVTITVYNDHREAKITAKSVGGQPVHFATGINYFDKLKIVNSDQYIATWGIHPEDVAAEKVAIGAAIMYNKDDFIKQIDDGKQILLISKITDQISTVISACSTREEQLNSFDKFKTYLNNFNIESYHNDTK